MRNNKATSFMLCCNVLLIAAVWMIKVTLSPVCVTGDSMKPTYQNGEILVTDVRFQPEDILVGSVICFKSNGMEMIKRVEGIPGDSVKIDQGILYRNGTAVEEDFETMQSSGRFDSEYTLGQEEYFVLGDNRNNSKDSRAIGVIQYSQITNIVREDS